MNLLEPVVNILEQCILSNNSLTHNATLCDPQRRFAMHFCSTKCRFNHFSKQRIKFILSTCISTDAKKGLKGIHISITDVDTLSEFSTLNDSDAKTNVKETTIKCNENTNSDNYNAMNLNLLITVEDKPSPMNQFNTEAASCKVGTLISRARMWARTTSQAAQMTGTVGSIVVKL